MSEISPVIFKANVPSTVHRSSIHLLRPSLYLPPFLPEPCLNITRVAAATSLRESRWNFHEPSSHFFFFFSSKRSTPLGGTGCEYLVIRARTATHSAEFILQIIFLVREHSRGTGNSIPPLPPPPCKFRRLNSCEKEPKVERNCGENSCLTLH